MRVHLIICSLLLCVVDGKENVVLGVPIVSCEEESIDVRIETARPFHGRIFVKGQHANKQCVQHFADKEDDSSRGLSRSSIFPSDGVCPPCECEEGRRKRKTNIVGLQLPLNTCNMQSDRIPSPPAVRLSFVLVVSFHQNFVTKMDKAYKVQCLYGESNRVLKAELDVGMRPSLNISSVVSPSSCQYSIRHLDGRLVSNVRVGDVVTHEWKCNSIGDIYSLLVHNCSVEDANGQRMTIIDDRGCTTDPFLISTPSYSSSLSASLQSAVFKFPDRSSIQFQCKLSLCLKEDNHCSSITPPECNTRYKRSSSVPSSLPTWTLHSRRIFTMDEFQSLPESPLPAQPFCLSITAFSILVSILSCLATTSLGVICILYRPIHSRDSL